jgi:hypothetical protein
VLIPREFGGSAGGPAVLPGPEGLRLLAIGGKPGEPCETGGTL